MENLKEVDWSKAPEGATHYNEERSRPWLRDVPASFYYDGHWINYTSDNDYGKDHFSNAVKRPQEWDGSGLPPIGTVCEFLKRAKYRTSWIKVRVVFIGGNLIVFEHGANGNEFSEQIADVSFRPIKTPEQIAAEERLHAIDEMDDLILGWGVYKNMLAVLYDAGYRKTEVKK